MAINIIVPQDAEKNFYNQDTANLLSGALLYLFTNSVTVSSTDTLSTYTACTAPGCGPITLSGWGSPVIDGSGAAAGSPTTPTFTPSSSGGSGNTYGGFLTDSSGTKLLGSFNWTSVPVNFPQSVPVNLPLNYSVLSRF